MSKKCSNCGGLYGIDCFYKRRASKDGLQNNCKQCSKIKLQEYLLHGGQAILNARRRELRLTEEGRKHLNELEKKTYVKNYQRKYRDRYVTSAINRRINKNKQTPIWADLSSIKSIYQRAAVLRFQGQNVHVDHIIPLKGKNVSGLHVHYNLQIIPQSENLSKGNRYVEN